MGVEQEPGLGPRIARGRPYACAMELASRTAMRGCGAAVDVEGGRDRHRGRVQEVDAVVLEMRERATEADARWLRSILARWPMSGASVADKGGSLAANGGLPV